MTNSNTVLDRLISKHTEQSEYYYRRLNVFLGANGALLAGGIAIVTSDLPWSARFGLLAVLALAGAWASSILCSVLRASTEWVAFWKGRIAIHELRLYAEANPKPHESEFFFLDRYLKDPSSDILPTELPPHFDREKLTMALDDLRMIWSGEGGGVGKRLMALLDSAVLFWGIVCVVSAVLVVVSASLDWPAA